MGAEFGRRSAETSGVPWAAVGKSGVRNPQESGKRVKSLDIGR